MISEKLERSAVMGREAPILASLPGGEDLEGQHDVHLPEGSRGTVVVERRLWIAHFSERNAAQSCRRWRSPCDE
jgi:hypothetical protein